PRRGPRLVVGFGGILVALGWVMAAQANSLALLYLSSIVAGVGGGAIYAASVGHAVKWFPDRRGLAVGLAPAGYGAGAAVTIVPIRYVIDHFGYEAAFFWFGLLQGGAVFAIAWLLRGPEADDLPLLPASKVLQSVRNYSPSEVLKSPVFWLLYLMFVMVSAS